MHRYVAPLVLWAAVAVACPAARCQNRDFQPRPGVFPPEIILDRFIDVVKIAPKLYAVEVENDKVRVLRAKLPAEARVPTHDSRSGLLVAVTDVHVRFRTADSKIRDIHVAAGETRWIDAEPRAEENLDIRPCEFLFVETKN